MSPCGKPQNEVKRSYSGVINFYGNGESHLLGFLKFEPDAINGCLC